jgi:hypothetical protein
VQIAFPVLTSLHVGDILGSNLSILDLLLGVKDRQQVLRFPLRLILLERLQGSRLETLRAVGSELLFIFLRLFLSTQLAKLFRRHAVWGISHYKRTIRGTDPESETRNVLANRGQTSLYSFGLLSTISCVLASVLTGQGGSTSPRRALLWNKGDYSCHE